MKIENGVTNFAVYEDATEYYGMAEVTLPEITQISEEVKGAGIAGTFDGTFVGHLEAMFRYYGRYQTGRAAQAPA